MGSPRPLHVVAAGGGIATLELLLALRSVAREAVEVTVIAPGTELAYRPEAVGAPFDRSPRRYPLGPVVTALGAHLRPGVLRAVDGPAHEVVLDDGARHGYDALVVAVGSRNRPAFDGAITFRPSDTAPTRQAVRELEEGAVERVAFVAPPRAWALPVYELALMTAQRVRSRAGLEPGAVTVVTAEPAPLAALRGAASDAVGRRLEAAGVVVRAGHEVRAWRDGALELDPPTADGVRADRVIALPTPVGPGVDGLPLEAGFVQVDGTFAVPGVPDVHAIGDAASYPVKQGGLATQQADVVAASLARRAGVDVPLRPFAARLRATLWTGTAALYLSADLHDGEPVASDASERAPWWPPDKVAGVHLAPFLVDADELGVDVAVARADDRAAHPAAPGPLLATPDDVGILPLDREA